MLESKPLLFNLIESYHGGTLVLFKRRQVATAVMQCVKEAKSLCSIKKTKVDPIIVVLTKCLVTNCQIRSDLSVKAGEAVPAPWFAYT